MAIQPRKPLERVQFYEDHLAPFTANMAAIGLVSGDLSNLTSKTESAREAYNAQQSALTASRAATEAFKNAVNALTNAGEDCLNKIRGKAKMTGNPDVYTLAQIPGPVTPQPAGDPGMAFDFKAELDTDGSLKSKWKNTNATGCVYWIYRALNGAAEFETLGGVGTKKYVDATIPQGTTQVLYKIQAVRSTGVGPWAYFNVFFGSGTGSMLVTEGKPLKAAA